MRSKKLNLYLVEDLLNDLHEMDSLISMHRSANNDFMVAQYEERKLRIFNKLIGHLADSGLDRQDPKILYYINQLINRFFPEARQQPAQPEYESLNALLGVRLTPSSRLAVQEPTVEYGGK
jgi:hypothetical protein